MTAPTLRIRDLTLSFGGWRGSAHVLHGISLHVGRGERVALVGESGSGKSVTARIVLGLLQQLASAKIAGLVEFEGRDLAGMTEVQRRALRGIRMSMISQDPTSSLNPVFPIGRQFHEVLSRKRPGLAEKEAHALAAQALADVAIHDADRVLGSYPFQLSGGMNQRVMIAMAMVNQPALLIADEPGTALDVTVQAQTLALMRDLVDRNGTSVLFISHNLGVVREFADRVYVIYKGRIVEHARAVDLFAHPRHPYTRALIEAVPHITGGGIPRIEEDTADFGAPMVVQAGCGEPEGDA